MTPMPAKIKYLSYFVILFGVLTIFSGGQNLFNADVIKAQGKIVPAVLWFNFLAGLLYVIIAVGVLKRKRIALRLTAFLSALNMVVLLYLLNHSYDSGAYQMKTLVAMSFRTFFWFIFFVLLSRSELYRLECKC